MSQERRYAAAVRTAAATTTYGMSLPDVRVPAAAMLVAAAARPMLHGSPGVSCPLRALTGIPCPLCGMTTSVTAAVHADLGAAIAANPAGIVAVVIAVLAVIGVRRSITAPPGVVGATLAAMWLWQLARFSVL